MLVNGKMTYFMEKVVIYFNQAKDIKDNLYKEEKKDRECTYIQMVIDMKGHG